MSDEGLICTNHEDKAWLVDEFYDNLLGIAQDNEHTIDLNALGINYHDLADLDFPFSEDEEWKTIKDLQGFGAGWIYKLFL